MKFFDFNFSPLYEHHGTAFHSFLEAVDEYGPNGFRATHGVPPELRVSTLRRSLSGPSLRQRFFLLGSIPLPGFRSTHLSGKSARHRSLSARPAIEALS